MVILRRDRFLRGYVLVMASKRERHVCWLVDCRDCLSVLLKDTLVAISQGPEHGYQFRLEVDLHSM